MRAMLFTAVTFTATSLHAADHVLINESDGPGFFDFFTEQRIGDVADPQIAADGTIIYWVELEVEVEEIVFGQPETVRVEVGDAIVTESLGTSGFSTIVTTGNQGFLALRDFLRPSIADTGRIAYTGAVTDFEGVSGNPMFPIATSVAHFEDDADDELPPMFLTDVDAGDPSNLTFIEMSAGGHLLYRFNDTPITPRFDFPYDLPGAPEEFEAYTSAMQNSNGDVVLHVPFVDPVDTAVQTDGIWLLTEQERQLIALTGSDAPAPVPSIYTRLAANPVLDDTGNVTYWAERQQFEAGFIETVYVWNGAASSILFDTHTELVGMSVNRIDPNIATNARGDTVMHVTLDAPAETNRALVLSHAGQHAIVAREGDPVPDAGAGATISLIGEALVTDNDTPRVIANVWFRADDLPLNQRQGLMVFTPNAPPSLIIQTGIDIENIDTLRDINLVSTPLSTRHRQVLAGPGFDATVVYRAVRDDFSNVIIASTVGNPADLDTSGAIDIADLLEFLDRWLLPSTGVGDVDPSTDFNTNGQADIADLLGFLTLWFQG